MYKHILIPVDIANDRIDYQEATEVARRLTAEGGRISLLHVVEPIPVYAQSYILPDFEINSRKTAAESLSKLAETLGLDAMAVVIGSAGRSIVDWSEENGVDCIVVASHKPGLSNLVLGSTATWIVRHSPTAIHVLR